MHIGNLGKIKKFVYSLLCKKEYQRKHVKIGRNVTIQQVEFEGGNRIMQNSVVSNCTLGYGTYIGNDSKVIDTVIGRYCSIGSNLNVVNAFHPAEIFVSTHPAFYSIKKQAGFTYTDEQRFEEKKYLETERIVGVAIGHDVWIGNDVTIIAGVRIGNGAIVGTRALVTKDIPDYAIVGGVPAKVIKKRFSDEDIAFLQESQWWSRGEQWIKNHKDCFQNIDIFKETVKNENL
jgi:acetyltransferase-like isoleucine patch superfamily enzyme